MQRILIFLFLAYICLPQITSAQRLKEIEAQDTSIPSDLYEPTANFDYDPEEDRPRLWGWNQHLFRQKSNPNTTPRPFISYWQNIMRNVRLPVPSITWNVTNPLANLFNAENEQLEQTTALDDYYNLRSQRRHKQKRRRKHSNKRHRKHQKRPIAIEEEQQQQQQQQIELENQALQQQILLQQYPAIPNNVIQPPNALPPPSPLPAPPMYFYDPNTDAYYAVQRIGALGSYAEGTLYNPVAQPATFNADNENKHLKEEENETTNDLQDDEEDENDINLDEAEEIDLDQVSKNENVGEKSTKGNVNEETLRNLMGSFMRDDDINRQMQRTKEKKKINSATKSKPRKSNYYFLLGVN